VLACLAPGNNLLRVWILKGFHIRRADKDLDAIVV